MRFFASTLAAASAVAALALAAGPASADVKTGVDAWQRGDFGFQLREIAAREHTFTLELLRIPRNWIARRPVFILLGICVAVRIERR